MTRSHIEPKYESLSISCTSVLHENKVEMGGHVCVCCFFRVWVGRYVACEYLERMIWVLVNFGEGGNVEGCGRRNYWISWSKCNADKDAPYGRWA